MDYEQALPKLTEQGIRYLVVGAIGAALSGYTRATMDLDLLVDLDEKNLQKVLAFMEQAKYVPRAPVPANELLDPKKRQAWYDEKNLRAFTFVNLQNPTEDIDLLLYSPIVFGEAWDRKQTVHLNKIPIYVASIDDLITLKKGAVQNRKLPKDIYDLAALEKLQRRTT